MSSSAASLHNQRLPAEAEHSQRVPGIDPAQQIKLKERQRFFEEVIQHDVDHHMYLSPSHLTIRDYRRPPIGSISSMEVNVDMLEQMELFDIPDHESLDVFFTGTEEGTASPVPAPGNNNNNNEEVIGNGLLRHVLEGWDAKYRMSSTSSNSSSSSENTNDEGVDTPVFQSDEDDDEAHASAGLHSASSTEREKGKQSPSSS